MYARVVRFTDATPEQIAAVVSRVEESDGPPPGVDSVGMQLMVDERQGTAIFIGLFDDEQKLRDANAILERWTPPRRLGRAPRWTSAR